MERPFILVGDTTSHGGKVIEGSTGSTVDGKPIARVGDAVTCPMKGHGGVTKIVTGDTTCLIDGKPAARDGDLTACGAKLMAALQTFVTSDAGGNGGSKAAKKPPAADDYKQNMESLKSEDRLGDVLNNDAATLVAGPTMLTGNSKADVLAWYITPYGKTNPIPWRIWRRGKISFIQWATTQRAVARYSFRATTLCFLMAKTTVWDTLWEGQIRIWLFLKHWMTLQNLMCLWSARNFNGLGEKFPPAMHPLSTSQLSPVLLH